MDTSPVARFVIEGRPVPAVRMTQRGKWVRLSAKRYLAYREVVGWTAKLRFPQPWTCPVGVFIAVHTRTFRGDLDNIVKSVLDGLNGVAWKDDAQVVEIRARRYSDTRERVEVVIWQAKVV